MNRPDLAKHLCYKHEAPIMVLGFDSLPILRRLHALQHWPHRGLPLLAWRPWLRLFARPVLGRTTVLEKAR